MDRNAFDRLARQCAVAASRRALLGALLGIGAAGATGEVTARKFHRARGKGKARVGAEATCASPGHGQVLPGCDFTNQDLENVDLASSMMKGTIFRGTNLCGANLRSSQLKDADFRGFAEPDRPTILYKANLAFSSCSGTQFNNRSLFCGTTLCNGTISNRDCPAGIAAKDICCDCDGPNQICDHGTCRTCDVCASGCAFDSAPAAIAAAAAGATVVICPGAYGGAVTIDKNLTIVGAGSGAGGTVLNGAGDGGSSAHVQVQQDRVVILRDLTVSGRNNISGVGGGLRAFTNAQVTLTRVRVTGNRGTLGGGIFNEGLLTLEAETAISGNSADAGGGVYNRMKVNARPGSTVSGNAPDNCVNVGSGSGCP